VWIHLEEFLRVFLLSLNIFGVAAILGSSKSYLVAEISQLFPLCNSGAQPDPVVVYAVHQVNEPIRGSGSDHHRMIAGIKWRKRLQRYQAFLPFNLR
jgi:hypothetical protein